MFIKVSRSAAVSALSAGLMVRLDATGEILQLGIPGLSKRASRRMLSNWSWYLDENEQPGEVTFSIYKEI